MIVKFSRLLRRNKTFCYIFKIAMIAWIVVYVVLFNFFNKGALSLRSTVDNEASSFNEPWIWECQEGECVRVAAADSTQKPDSFNFTSIDECRLVCLPYSTVWPKPTGIFKVSRDVQTVNVNSIKFSTDNVRGGDEAKNYLKTATEEGLIKHLSVLCPNGEQTKRRRFGEYPPFRNNANPVPVSIYFTTSETNDMKLDWTTNESYGLEINNTKTGITVSIKSMTVFGARHALQTLSQLFACRRSSDNVLILMSDARITDYPTYQHRGLLLDTSRHFLPVAAILRTLDAMAASKLNVFHWHATDSHSFPLYMSKVPQMTRFGAYSPDEIYMPEDVAMIRQYAFQRGIRILLEIDSPSHAGYGWQWGEETGLGKLAVCVGAEPWRKYCVQPPCGQLNPINDNLYNVLEKIYSEIKETFPHDMFHMGGDEVFFPCWRSDPGIVAWMDQRKMNSTVDNMLLVWSMFQSRALAAWDRSLNKTEKNPIVLWSSQLTEPDHIEKYLDPTRYVIQTWTEAYDDTPLQLISKGYKVIVSTKDAWYLDHGFWGNTVYSKWNNVYDNEIIKPEHGVYGGEVCLWGEYVNDHNLDSRLWPRAACAAERLWSNPTSTADLALPRLLDHSKRLALVGVNPDAIVPQYCEQNDAKC